MQGVSLRATKWERLFRSEDGAGLRAKNPASRARGCRNPAAEPSSRICRLCSHDDPEVRRNRAALVPLRRVPERDLMEAHTLLLE